MPTTDANPRPRLLLVDDNAPSRSALARLLDLQGFDVTEAGTGTAALEQLGRGAPPDVLVTDLRLPDLDGRDIVRHAVRLDPAPIVALITGWDVEAPPDGRGESGIDLVYLKPIEVNALAADLRRALAQRHG